MPKALLNQWKWRQNDYTVYLKIYRFDCRKFNEQTSAVKIVSTEIGCPISFPRIHKFFWKTLPKFQQFSMSFQEEIFENSLILPAIQAFENDCTHFKRKSIHNSKDSKYVFQSKPAFAYLWQSSHFNGTFYFQSFMYQKYLIFSLYAAVFVDVSYTQFGWATLVGWLFCFSKWIPIESFKCVKLPLQNDMIQTVDSTISFIPVMIEFAD